MVAMTAPPLLTIRSADGEQVLPLLPGLALRDMLEEAGFPLRSACGGRAACGLCRVQLLEGQAPPLSAAELRHLSPEQREAGIRLSCQLRPVSAITVAVETVRVDARWRIMEEDEFPSLAVPLQATGQGRGYGLAVDLGTTHIRLTLWDLARGRRLCGFSGLNPQAAYGADVLTRLMVAGRSVKLAKRMQTLVQDAIGEAMGRAIRLARISLQDIQQLQIVGNTAMLALLAGQHHQDLLNPAGWTHCLDYQPSSPAFFQQCWHLSDQAQVRLAPAVGGFVGADLRASVLATGLEQGVAGALLVDFGTNSEIALWDGHTLFVTAAAGGPAFEGSGISCGMAGEKGAIYRVEAGPGHELVSRVLGDGEAEGICGSGLVDAMACLRRTGRLDRVGRLQGGVTQGIALTPQLHLTALDIDVFQRAKAAIGAGIQWLCQQAGIEPRALQRIVACGAFGRLLDVDNAQEIGLLPRTDSPVTVELEANAALGGCELMLLAGPGAPPMLNAPLRLFNLAEDPEFEMLFVRNLYVQPLQD